MTWVTCRVKLCHYIMVEAAILFKLLPPSILDIKSVWAHWYAVYRHMVAALLSYPAYLAQISVIWVTCGVKWCHYAMVMTALWFKMLPPSILDIYKVFEHIDIDMLSIAYGSSLTQLYPAYLAQIMVISGSLVESNDAIMSWLWLQFYSNCFPHPYETYTKCLSTLICCP